MNTPTVIGTRLGRQEKQLVPGAEARRLQPLVNDALVQLGVRTTFEKAVIGTRIPKSHDPDKAAGGQLERDAALLVGLACEPNILHAMFPLHIRRLVISSRTLAFV
jgi:hypothetical protein